MKNKQKIQKGSGNLTGLRLGFLMLFVLVLVAYFTFAPFFPHRVNGISAPADQFSAERAMQHLRIIASEPHPQGSPAQARVRDYIVQELSKIGMEVNIQQKGSLENVVARLPGSSPGGAILILAHYDSSFNSPGAADNGSGVSTLIEVMRAMAVGRTPHNDIIALFDDGEELPDAFTGSKIFVREHPWMADVRVAIGTDTAVRGFICTDDTGSQNGWMVQALSHAYTGGAWYSLSGGGNYDSKPFRDVGIQVLELEDNYPFYEQHTPGDVPSIINPGTLQQLGDQALSVARELSGLDLSVTHGEQEAYASIPFIGLIHYPESWSLSFAILAGVLLIAAFILTLVRKLTSWRGLALALLAITVTSGLSAIGTNALWNAAPRMFGWEINRWSEWPEVIPPHGWLIFVLSNLVVLGLMVVIYRPARRWSSRADFSMTGLSLLLVLAFICAVAIQKAAILPVWPVLIGAVCWILISLLERKYRGWRLDLAVLLSAIPIVMFTMPLFPGVFMGDGTKSVAILSGVLPLLLSVILPAVDRLLVSRRAILV